MTEYGAVKQHTMVLLKESAYDDCMCGQSKARGYLVYSTHLLHMGMVTLDCLPIIQCNKSYMLSALLEAGENFLLMLKTIQQK